MSEEIPLLYATDDTPFEQKIIHQRYQIKRIGFYWLIAEIDKEKNLAFGFANLNNDDFAEWGYIDIQDLNENGATPDTKWEPCTFKEAMQRIAHEKASSGKLTWLPVRKNLLRASLPPL